MISIFTSISFDRNFGCMDSFSHSFSDASKDVLVSFANTQGLS
ncbi:hypothetical protein Hanom_Chr17g01564081 [Helianthus anomalus]